MTTIFRSISLLTCLALTLASGCMTEPPERQAAFQTLAIWEDQRFAPEDSLLSMIKNDDAHVRLRALRCAGLIGQRSVVPAMIEALEDPSETVGRQAAFSLGLIGDASATESLEAILSVPGSRLHLAAARGLAHLPNDGRGLLIATTNPDLEVASAAWDGLRNVATEVDSTWLVTAISDGLSHDLGDVLWRVLRCSERFPAHELIPYMAPHARSNIAQVRVHAYRALARQDQASALRAVLQGYQHGNASGDRHQRVQIALCRALGSLGANGFSADNPLNEEERHLLVEALIESAGHPNHHLAATALAAMENLAEQFELPTEAAEQESLLPVWRIRLGRAAKSHLQNENPVVRAAAIRSWASLRGSGSENELYEMLTQPNSGFDVEAILYALGRQADSPLGILAGFASSQTNPVGVRVAALEALHHLGTKSTNHSFVLDTMTQAAADPDFVVAATAVGYLASFPERLSLVSMVEAWDTSYSEGEAEVKRAILATLNSYGPGLMDIRRTNLPEGIDDRVLTTISGLIREAFDSPDLRIRLEARQAALATKALPVHLIPTDGSLRATLPRHQRAASQPSVRTPFSAPKVQCTTEAGLFIIQLDGEIAPNTCAMFMDLVNDGFYDDLTFHRVVPDFVVQGGDPRGDGWGGPGYTIRSEWSRVRYERGYVGIAHDGKDTGGSQFFVTLSEQPHLNGRYTIFGKVVEGMDVVDQVGAGDHFHLKVLP